MLQHGVLATIHCHHLVECQIIEEVKQGARTEPEINGMSHKIELNNKPDKDHLHQQDRDKDKGAMIVDQPAMLMCHLQGQEEL